MGKQINFFQTLQDIKDLFSYLQKKGLVIFNKHKEHVLNLDEMLDYSQVYIGFLDSTLVSCSNNANPFNIDQLESEVIEYSIGGKINYIK